MAGAIHGKRNADQLSTNTINYFIRHQTINNMASKKTALVIRGTGKFKGQFRFKLLAANGKCLAPSNDFYKRKGRMVETIKRNFPGFEIVHEDSIAWQQKLAKKKKHQ